MADVRLRDLNPAEFNFGVNVAGNLGVGTTSPSAKVEIVSDGSDAAGAEIRLQHANNNSTDVVSTVNFANNVGPVAMIQGGTTSGNTNGYISFHTDSGGTSAERMRILSDGKVGIGTTSPSDLLQLSASSPVIRGHDTDGGSAKINFGSGNITLDADFAAGESSSLINFKVDGTERVRIDSSGRVGIGTTSPANLLHVLGNSANGEIKAERSSGAVSLIQAQASLVRFGTTSNHNLQFFTNDTGRVTITNAGRVGIGTTSPTDLLTVGDGTSSVGITINKSVSGTGTLEFENAGTDKCYVRCSADEALIFGTGDSDRVSILENGNVGIGVTTPTEALHVNGNLIVTGTVDVGSSGFNVSSGFILPFGGGTAPSGWLECNGAAVSRSTYSDLFAIIGTIYGAGDGSTTFNLPDLQGRVIMGQGGNTASRTPTDLENIGDTFGSQTHSLQVSELPPHNHSATTTYPFMMTNDARRGTQNGKGMRANEDKFKGSVTGFVTTIDDTGGDEPHNNIQPSIVINYLIKT